MKAIGIGFQIISVVLTLYFTVEQYFAAINENCFDTYKGFFIEIFITISLNAILLLIQGFAVLTLSLQLLK